jgi:hypothetical protein
MHQTVNGSATRPDPVVLSIDHRFVEPEHVALLQAVYDALGALDVAAPLAILPLRTDDLRVLLEGSARRSRVGASRRIRFMLERRVETEAHVL